MVKTKYDKEIKLKQQELADLKQARKESISRKMVACNHCNKKSVIGKLTCVQTHWYTRPHGCTGGDYWNQGEGQFDCPKCGERNRIYEHTRYEDGKYIGTGKGSHVNLLDMKYYFKDVVNEYDR